MSTSRKSGWGPREFTLPTYEIQRAAENQHGVWIVVKLSTGFQRGVYRVVVASQPLVAHDYHLKHSVSEDWPNARVQSFEACLFSLMGKLSVMLDNAAADAERQRYKQGRLG